MDSRRLNRRITIQRPGSVQDDRGQPIPGWVEVAKPWASIKHPSGLSAIKADAPTSVVRASIRIRYRTDVLPGMRALHGATVYDIKAVLPDEVKREHVDLVCEVVK